MEVGYTVRRVLESQVEAWRKVLASDIQLNVPGPILCVGSGTSYYLAMVMAHIGNKLGLEMLALPAQDLIMEPRDTLARYRSVMVISRSGSTSEAVWAAQVSKAHGKQVLGVTCDTEAPLAHQVEYLWALPEAHDHTVVMIRSFTSMLMAFQVAVDRLFGSHAQDIFAKMVDTGEAFIHDADVKIRELVRVPPRRVYVLGSGVRHGIALEGALKSLEMSNENAYAYGPLEFRHGPWGSVTADDLVVLLGQVKYAGHEQEVVRDLSKRTARLLVIAQPAWFDRVEVPGHQLKLPIMEDDLWAGPLAVTPLQWLGWHWAVATGRNPDAPKDLTAVVDLDYGF